MFYASFVVGFEGLVGEIIEKEFSGVIVRRLLGGAVIYDTRSGEDDLESAAFLNNHFRVVEMTEGGEIEEFMEGVTGARLERGKKKRSFRVVVSDQNKLVSVDEKRLRGLEEKIIRGTGNYVDRVKPEVEYWVLRRSEGVMLFMERVGKHRSFDKVLEKGELRGDLCYFLNYLSEPREDDVFLDCFCGSGAIIKSRIGIERLKMAFGVDMERDKIQALRRQYKGRNDLVFKSMDFFENKFEDGFIDKIVTDPPWGEYEGMEDAKGFYQRFMREAERIVGKGGRVVVLTARKEEIREAETGMRLSRSYDILVSGKKAGVFVYER